LLKYPALIHKDPDGLWLEFPGLENVFTQGDTMDELIRNAEDVLSLYIGDLFDDGKEIPKPLKIDGENILYVALLPDTAIPVMLREARKNMNLTQSDVAERVGKTYQAYQRLENAGKCNIRIKTLEKIARALGKKIEINLI